MKNNFTIAKFGGTSVANVNAIEHCIQIIEKSPQTKIVVVSAQSGVRHIKLAIDRFPHNYLVF